MYPKILLVDDDESALAAYRRTLRGLYEIDTAASGSNALEMLSEELPYAVVVADMHMPGMNGLELLQKIREVSPDTTRIMLTGDADQRTAADAVNHGRVFRFLGKPCDPQEMLDSLAAGVHQHQLVRAERDLLEQTLSGAIGCMTELLSSVDPRAFGCAQMLKYRAVRIARMMRIDHDWEIGLAALLSPIGRLTIPPRLLHLAQAGEPLTKGQRDLIDRIPEFGARLLRQIPRLEDVANSVRYQNRGFDGSGLPDDGPVGKSLPVGARILKPLLDVMQDEQDMDMRFALDRLLARRARYDPEVLAVTRDFLETEMLLVSAQRTQPVEVSLAQLKEGQVLASPVATDEGTLVLLPGIRLSEGQIQLLRNLTEFVQIREPIRIRSEKP